MICTYLSNKICQKKITPIFFFLYEIYNYYYFLINLIIHIFILIIIFGSSRCCFINTRERSADPFSTWTNTAKKKEVNKQNKYEVIFFPQNKYCYYLHHHFLLPSVTIYFGSSSIFIKFMISYAICKDKNKYWNLDYGQKASAFYWHTWYTLVKNVW